MNPTRSASFALDLSRQPEGYLVESSDVIDALRDSGLITTRPVGEGFVIIKAVVGPVPPRTATGRRWTRLQPAIQREAAL